MKRLMLLALVLVVVAGCVPAPVVRSEAVLWDARLTQLKAGIAPAMCYNKPHFEIVKAWLVTDPLRWDDPALPSWAKAEQFDGLGGATHVWGRALDPDGNPYAGAGFLLSWPDGSVGALSEAGNREWANAYFDSGYNWAVTGGPGRWTKGPSSVAPCGSEVFVGGGLPYPPLPWQASLAALDYDIEGGVHTSWYVVFQLVEAQPTPTPVPTVAPTPGPLGGAYWLRWGPFKLAVELEAR